MKAPSSSGSVETTDDCMLRTTVEKFTGQTSHQVKDSLAIEEPLEIQLTHGPSDIRQTRSISVTMRTPGNDFELAAGFLMTEGVIRDANDVEQIVYAAGSFDERTPPPPHDVGRRWPGCAQCGGSAARGWRSARPGTSASGGRRVRGRRGGERT